MKLGKKEWENKQKEISKKKDDLTSQSSKLTVKEKELNADYQVATDENFLSFYRYATKRETEFS